MLLTDKDISFTRILAVPGVAFAYVVTMLGIFNFLIFSAILPLKLTEFGIGNEDMGYIYMLVSGPYVLTCLVYPLLFSKIPPKLQYVLGLTLAAIGLTLVADSSTLFHLPNSQALVFSGLAIIGCANALNFIPATPEILGLLTVRYRIVDGVDEELVAKMNDSVSALY